MEPAKCLRNRTSNGHRHLHRSCRTSAPRAPSAWWSCRLLLLNVTVKVMSPEERGQVEEPSDLEWIFIYESEQVSGVGKWTFLAAVQSPQMAFWPQPQGSWPCDSFIYRAGASWFCSFTFEFLHVSAVPGLKKKI